MIKKKQLICIVCAIMLLFRLVVPVFATEEGAVGAGEMNQDNSGVVEDGGQDAPDTNEEQKQEETKTETKTETKQQSYLDIKNQEINNAQAEKKKLESNISNVKKMKNELEKSKYDLNVYVTELDNNLNEIESKLSNLNTLIEEKEQDIAETKEELAKAQESQKVQYTAMKQRIKFMYEKGEYSFIEIVLGAGSFSEMLNKLEYVKRLSAYDQKKMEEYQQTIEYVKVCQEELNAQQETLQAAAKAAEDEQAAVAELITEKQEQIEEYEEDISNKEKLIKEYEEDLAVQNSTISALEQAVAAEKKRLAESGQKSSVSYNGGKFAWPAPSYTRVSSDYGMRMHPVLNMEKFHNGVDMAAPNGSPIVAAYDGQVVAADYNASMGNYIMIDHGDGLYTVYMHCSALYVSSGAKVTKGANIAAVGSTGRSTGPHLHFSVRLNGNYVSPWNYL